LTSAIQISIMKIEGGHKKQAMSDKKPRVWRRIRIELTKDASVRVSDSLSLFYPYSPQQTREAQLVTILFA
jgi:hypothetical protein